MLGLLNIKSYFDTHCKFIFVQYFYLRSSGNYGDDVEVDTDINVDPSQNEQISHRDGNTLLVQGLIPFSTTEDELAMFFNVS